MIRLLDGDLGFTRSDHWLAQAILKLTRGNLPAWIAHVLWGRPIEGPSRVHHVFMVVGAGDLRGAWIIESQARTRLGYLWALYAGKLTDVSVWRLRGITDEQRKALAVRAMKFRGTRYGWWKWLAHFGDWLCGLYFFRRLFRLERFPECHWLAALSYDQVLGYRFGLPPNATDPDALWDYVTSHPKEWAKVLPLARLG